MLGVLPHSTEGDLPQTCIYPRPAFTPDLHLIEVNS